MSYFWDSSGICSKQCTNIKKNKNIETTDSFILWCQLRYAQIKCFLNITETYKGAGGSTSSAGTAESSREQEKEERRAQREALLLQQAQERAKTEFIQITIVSNSPSHASESSDYG